MGVYYAKKQNSGAFGAEYVWESFWQGGGSNPPPSSAPMRVGGWVGRCVGGIMPWRPFAIGPIRMFAVVCHNTGRQIESVSGVRQLL